MTFKALVVDKVGDRIVSELQLLDDERLREGDVEVEVEYSTINYKDGLVLQGMGSLVKTYPHVPGIDFAGVVRHSDSASFKAGDRVVLTGWRVGEVHWGGLAERARVKAEWLLPIPNGLSARDTMIAGTAGLTAMLAVCELEAQGLSPSRGPVLVTGATGGVGTFATAILAKLGHEVHAVSGKPEKSSYLTDLGAKAVIAREEFSEPSKRPLEAARWAGCIDAVGGTVLARALAQMDYAGVVAAVGLAGGAQLQATVVPFLLRAVRLIGIDSVMCPLPARRRAWNRLAELDVVSDLQGAVREIGLEDALEAGRDIVAGKIAGRVIVKP